MEDEAALINQHINSLKLDVARQKQGNGKAYNLNKQQTDFTNDNSIGTMNAPKSMSMKQMIEESIKENNLRKEALKKTLNFDSLNFKKHP